MANHEQLGKNPNQDQTAYMGSDSRTKYAGATIGSITPTLITFIAKGIYPQIEVDSDKNLLVEWNKKKKDEQKSHNGVLLEETFAASVGLGDGDWFGEQESYENDPSYSPLRVVRTTDIDDVFNHVDFVCTIKNECTRKRAMPFAIDLSYNTDDKKLEGKFRWRHVYGRDPKLSMKNSEFGYLLDEEDKPLRFSLGARHGLGIPGFASVKYYDEQSVKPLIPTGRIEIMPRFIVGYDVSTMETLEKREPGEQFRIAEERAKWCVLLQLLAQAHDIRHMVFTGIPETATNREELRIARKQTESACKYFEKAIEVAAKEAAMHTESVTGPLGKGSIDRELAGAKEYAKNSYVTHAIIEQSRRMYIEKRWERERFND